MVAVSKEMGGRQGASIRTVRSERCPDSGMYK
jgi:hypothetical protein